MKNTRQTDKEGFFFSMKFVASGGLVYSPCGVDWLGYLVYKEYHSKNLCVKFAMCQFCGD